MQNYYTESKICLPKRFDVCKDYENIWRNTIFKSPDGVYSKLEMSSVKSKGIYNDLRISKIFENLDIKIFEYEKQIHESEVLCFDIEMDLEKIMGGNLTILDRGVCQLPLDEMAHWCWESWHLAMSKKFKTLYPYAVHFLNIGARNNGYSDIGKCWQEELEIPNLPGFTESLWYELKPIYTLLHGVLRYNLWSKFENNKLFEFKGSLPAHLLGNMWSQEWSSFQNLLYPSKDFNLDNNLRNKPWTTKDMVKKAEDFYTSMGLNQMTDKFWKNSVFGKVENSSKCHGSAANMFVEDDFRMIACLEKSVDDLYVVVHELGHIEYFMHLSNLPPIFQDSSNSAIGEAIGDAIFLAFMSPNHLNRLGLIDDLSLKPSKRGEKWSSLDLSLQLKVGLSKIPQIPFSYIIDKWRWKYFEGAINQEKGNDFFWDLCKLEQGIHPPNFENRHEYFDPSAKYHVADNTPYVR